MQFAQTKPPCEYQSQETGNLHCRRWDHYKPVNGVGEKMGSTQSAMAQEGQEHHRQKSRQKVACPRDSAIRKADWLTEEATEEKIKLEMGELLEPELQNSRDSRDSRDKKNKSK